ncbi:nucleoside deaminase [Alteribacillus iranensis]|uniref:tRNA(Arg) A34 adenosine deaminase TadA n=1 Tax=Alteribacillus iranensis TaxID=930128 RepID=A0A1I2CT03_9BACI|nr:nucleoside deaminase [Alteribacillus iranensis]SFE70870.1 tRNA(Arg) A34 adenosine deaminase TadA [Alteribacillus iranensis]
MDTFMARAVELAVHNVKQGGQPFGAVLAMEGNIISEGVNELHLTYDVSGHAEMIAIRKAQEKLQTNDLSNCIMYASGEPCPMCLTAIYYAGIQKVYYAESIEEANEVGFSSTFMYEELGKARDNRQLTMSYMPLTEAKTSPLQYWNKRK